jgi:hypothetical protein
MCSEKRENLFLIANRSLLYGKLIAPGKKACVRATLMEEENEVWEIE